MLVETGGHLTYATGLEHFEARWNLGYHPVVGGSGDCDAGSCETQNQTGGPTVDTRYRRQEDDAGKSCESKGNDPMVPTPHVGSVMDLD